MAREKKFNNIAFSRLGDLLEMPTETKLREITYVANCTNFRRLLLNKYGDPDMDIDHHIASDPDTKLTYLGYRKFLESDLKHIFTLSKNLSSNGYKRDVKYLAKQMLLRGQVSLNIIPYDGPQLYVTDRCNRPLLGLSNMLFPTTCGYPYMNHAASTKFQ